MIVSYKKVIGDIKREKEKLFNGVKTSDKLILNLEKRRDTLTGDHTKFYIDFKETLEL